MPATHRRKAAVGVFSSAALILASCSGSTAPQPGTPAFYWDAARTTYAASDYTKTIDNLDKIGSSQNEYAARAQPWLLVLTSGMAQGYEELADSFEAGARINRGNATAFHRQVSNCRSAANHLALQFAENFATFQKNNKDEYILLAFGYPAGSPTPVPLLTKISNGALPPPADIETAQRRAVERAVLLATCRAAGAADDPAKVQDLLKSGDGKVARAAFVTAMANVLYEQSQLYSHQKLDDPEKQKIFCSRALEALKTLPESKETKALNTKIEASLKPKKL
jgi:hypothetical protein